MSGSEIPTVVLASEMGYLSVWAHGDVKDSGPWNNFIVEMTKLSAIQGWKWERLDDGSQLKFFVPDEFREGFRIQLHLRLQSVCRQTGCRFHTVTVQMEW